MFHRLATSANKACTSRKSNQSETIHVVIFSVNTHKVLCGLTLSDVWSKIIAQLATERSV